MALSGIDRKSICNLLDAVILKDSVEDGFEPPEGLDDYSFCYTSTSEENIRKLVYFMFVDILGEHCFDKLKFCRFVITVCRNYSEVPYHNVGHALCVLQMCYAILKNNKEKFSTVEKQALLLSAFCHDVDHPGLNNAHMQLINSQLFHLFPESTLENHHYNTAVSILQEVEGHDILAGLPAADRQQILCIMEKAILATDLSKIKDKLESIKQERGMAYFNESKPSYRLNLFSILVSACDLGSICKPFEVYLDTAYLLYKEFHVQGDFEKAMGRSVPDLLNRRWFYRFPEQQLNFIQFVLPVFEELACCLPNTKPLLSQARQNCDSWKHILEWQMNPFKAIAD